MANYVQVRRGDLPRYPAGNDPYPGLVVCRDCGAVVLQRDTGQHDRFHRLVDSKADD